MPALIPTAFKLKWMITSGYQVMIIQRKKRHSIQKCQNQIRGERERE